MNILNPFLSFGAIVFQLFSDVCQIFIKRILNLFDGCTSLFVFSFNEFPNNCAFLINKTSNSCIACFSFVYMLGDHLQSHLLAPLSFLPDTTISLQMIEGKLFGYFGELCYSGKYDMFELVVAVIEIGEYAIKICFKISYLFFKIIDFSFGFCTMAYFEAVDLFREHENSIFGHVLCWIRLKVREQMFSFRNWDIYIELLWQIQFQ